MVVVTLATAAKAELRITVGEPFNIAQCTAKDLKDKYVKKEHFERDGGWGFWNYPELRKCADDSLLLTFSTREDSFLSVQRVPTLFRSFDQGNTWQPDKLGDLTPLSPRLRGACLFFNAKEPLYGMSCAGLSGFCNLSDGTSITYFYHTMRTPTPGIFVTSMWHSPDGGQTWEGPIDAEFKVPDNKLDNLGRGPAIWRRSVELSNGHLVTVAHCGFKGDRKARVIALGSSDKGRTWSYLGTVANEPKMWDLPNSVSEGFTEPIVCKLAGDELICVMRTQGHNPMYQCYSRNGGKTWTTPEKSGVDGVAPDMHLLSNGVLACSYGRPGAYIMFSEDGTGRQWTHHTCIFSGRSTYYTSFEEVSPGRLLFTFDTINTQDALNTEPANSIRGVYIDVHRAQ